MINAFSSKMARKIMLIGRHGKAPQKPEGGSFDELVPETVTEIHKFVKKVQWARRNRSKWEK